MSTPNEPTLGVPQTPRSFYLQLYVGAVVCAVVNVLLFMFIYAVCHHKYVIVSCRIALGLYILGLTSLCIYVNVRQLQRKFPLNWLWCGCIFICLSLGTALLVPVQEYVHVLLISFEVIAVMSFYLLLGSFPPPSLHPLLYIGLVQALALVITSIALKVISEYIENEPLLYTCLVHGLLWCVLCPLLMLQALVLNGHMGNTIPILDVPLCALLLFIDFLSGYIVLDATIEIGSSFGKMNDTFHLMRNVIAINM